ERGAVARGDRRGGIDRELAVIRRQAFPPARLAGVVEHRRRVAEEIEIYGFLRAGADLRHLLAGLIGIEHRAWERCERARLGRGHCELPIHGACNWRLHDRKLDVEQLEEATIRPHIRTILRDLVPHLITLPLASHGRSLHHGHAHDMMVWPTPARECSWNISSSCARPPDATSTAASGARSAPFCASASRTCAPFARRAAHRTHGRCATPSWRKLPAIPSAPILTSPDSCHGCAAPWRASGAEGHVRAGALGQTFACRCHCRSFPPRRP